MTNRTLTKMVIPFAAVAIIAHYAPISHAENMSNNNFILEMGSFNTSSGKAKSTKYTVATTVGETGPGLYTGKNFKVKAGFEYIYPITSPFSFALSENIIDFGILSATNPVTRTTSMTVSNANGTYKVIGYEDHPLVAPNGGRINDTTCDNGACTEIVPALWTNTLTYGFGFRCDNVQGTDCDPSFKSQDDYKQFADISKKESPQAIMSGTTAKKNEGKITYKVNIAGTQRPGTYANTITYIAIPSF